MSWKRAGAVAFYASCLMLSACAKEKAEPAIVAPEGLPKAEVARARKACDAYVERICACAVTHTELAEECTLAKARPQALELNLSLSTTPGLSGAEAQAVKVEARKIANACFEADGRIDVQKCPRASGSATSKASE